jgi:hypothetical protein
LISLTNSDAAVLGQDAEHHLAWRRTRAEASVARRLSHVACGLCALSGGGVPKTDSWLAREGKDLGSVDEARERCTGFFWLSRGHIIRVAFLFQQTV